MRCGRAAGRLDVSIDTRAECHCRARFRQLPWVGLHPPPTPHHPPIIACLPHLPLPWQGEDSDTAIHLAALYGHAECVRVLLEAGARADVADADGALPLHDAAVSSCSCVCFAVVPAVVACIFVPSR